MRASGSTGSRSILRVAGRLLGPLLALCMAMPALAEDIAWRQTSVVRSASSMQTVRVGVAMFANGVPATFTVNLRPVAPASNGKLPYVADLVMRLEDGATVVAEFRGESAVSPEGAPLPGTMPATGRFVSGSGRFAGITGAFTMNIRTGLDRTADGMLGDNFASCVGSYTLSR